MLTLDNSSRQATASARVVSIATFNCSACQRQIEQFVAWKLERHEVIFNINANLQQEKSRREYKSEVFLHSQPADVSTRIVKWNYFSLARFMMNVERTFKRRFGENPSSQWTCTWVVSTCNEFPETLCRDFCLWFLSKLLSDESKDIN